MPMYVGTIDLSDGKVDVTDPCYNKDVWCRFTTKVLPGKWHCYAGVENGGRCTCCRIVHEDFDNDALDTLFEEGEWATIGVDAGLAGFFADKPDFDDAEWSRFCNDMFNAESGEAGRFTTKYKRAYLSKKETGFEGFFTESGYGDGSYPVFVALTDGRYGYDAAEICALEIDFT